MFKITIIVLLFIICYLLYLLNKIQSRNYVDIKEYNIIIEENKKLRWQIMRAKEMLRE